MTQSPPAEPGTVVTDGTPADPTTEQSAADKLAQAEKRAKIEKIARLVMMFFMPFIMVSMLIGGYLAAMHTQAPHNLPIAVVGTSAQVEAFTAELDPDAVNLTTVGSAESAEELVLSRDYTGAVVLGEEKATVFVAGAAGAAQSSTVTALVTPVLLDLGLTISVDDVAPLPSSDPSGLGAMFMMTALILAGYLPLSIVLGNSPELLRFRRAIPLLAGWAALIAGLVWAVTGPVLGIIEGHTAAVLGVSWLAVFAVGAVQLFFTRIMGPMAVLAGMLLLMVLGVPASNMGMSMYSMPPLYAWLHNFLPAPAIGESLRAVLYFDGQGAWPHLWVLIVGAVLGVVLTLIMDALKRRKNPEWSLPGYTVPSLHGGLRPRRRRWRYVALLAFPLAMVGMMISSMLGAMGDPAPKDMPVAIVAATTEQADQTADALDEQMSGLFALTATDDEDAARTGVMGRDFVAAVVLPSAESPTMTLLVNQAGSTSARQVVVTIFEQVAAAQQLPVEVTDVAPLPTADSGGTVSMYLGMGWIMAGFMIIVVGANAAPSTRPLKKLLPILAGWSVFISAWLWVIADVFVGAIDGHFWQLWGVGAIAVFCVALFTTVIERLLGMFAIIPAIGILMFIGIPASGGALSVFMEPEIFRTLHDILPMPAAVESVKSILYFGGDVVGTHLLTLGIWGAASLVLVIIIDALKPLRTVPELLRDEPAEAENIVVIAEPKEPVTV